VAHLVGWAGFLTLLVFSSPATKGRRLRCVARFWGWQVWRRATSRPIEVVLPQGWRLQFPAWSELAGITAATGLHEPAEELFTFAFLRPGDAVVDAGANVGVYTVACAALGARVSAFEPSSRTRHALERNVRLNHLEDRVRIFPTALGDTTATVSLTTGFDVGNHLVEAGEVCTTGETVALRPLDSVLGEAGSWFDESEPALLKIDVEGHDAAVLRGARRTLSGSRPVVLVETWDGGAEVRRFLAELGYRVYRYDFEARVLVEYPHAWDGQANFIAIADEQLPEVERRINEAPAPVLAPPRVRWRFPAETSPPGTESRRRVAVVGMVPPGASGVRDYGHLLAEELVRRGFDAEDQWVVSEGLHWRRAVADSIRFLRIAFSRPRPVSVVWNYSSFAYGLRGLPLAGVLFGIVLRLRGATVVTVLHELSYPWGRRGWRGNVQAVTQWLAFRPVLAGSTAVVVTTDQRAEALHHNRRGSRLVIRSAPVFCTIGAPSRVSWSATGPSKPVVGILNYTGDGARPDVVVGALTRIDRSRRPTVALLGSPGPDHPTARHWRQIAEEAGVADSLEFSGVLPGSDLRERIEACTVILLPNDHGPSGRRTTLGAALAHGVPTVALDGPERWEELATEDALEIVPAEPAALASVLEHLLHAPDRQRELSANGRAFYERHMAVERLGQVVAGLLDDVQRKRRLGRRRELIRPTD
jgi:FkbM family methyltransferase